MLKDVKDIQTQSFLIFIIFKDLLDTFDNRLNHWASKDLFPFFAIALFLGNKIFVLERGF